MSIDLLCTPFLLPTIVQPSIRIELRRIGTPERFGAIEPADGYRYTFAFLNDDAVDEFTCACDIRFRKRDGVLFRSLDMAFKLADKR